MLPGMNENISYGDHVIHVQTEDLGREAAKVTTQLFLGGNVLVTKFIEYHSALDNDDVDGLITAIMQRQHQKLSDQLRKGKFDDKIAQHAETAHALDGPAPINTEALSKDTDQGEPADAPSPQGDESLEPQGSMCLEGLPPPRIIARKIHVQAEPEEPDRSARELRVIEEVIEHRALLLSSPQTESLDAAMHSLFDPEPEGSG